MQLAHAARLLASAHSLAALAPLAAAAGVDGPPVPLPRATLGRAGYADAGVTRAAVATGPGALRAFLADVEPGAAGGTTSDRPLRAAARALAAALTRRAPELLWLLVLRDTATGHLALAAWSPTPRGPRVAALVLLQHAHDLGVTESARLHQSSQ